MRQITYPLHLRVPPPPPPPSPPPSVYFTHSSSGKFGVRCFQKYVSISLTQKEVRTV